MQSQRRTPFMRLLTPRLPTIAGDTRRAFPLGLGIGTAAGLARSATMAVLSHTGSLAHSMNRVSPLFSPSWLRSSSSALHARSRSFSRLFFNRPPFASAPTAGGAQRVYKPRPFSASRPHRCILRHELSPSPLPLSTWSEGWVK